MMGNRIEAISWRQLAIYTGLQLLQYRH